MPCRFACRRPRLSFATPDPNAASPPVAALDAYRQNRRTWLFMLRRQTRVLMFLFATLEAIWRGPSDIVQGKNYNAEIDHGFVYSIGYFFSWVFGCVFTVIWASLFEWWVPDFTSAPSNDAVPNPSKLEQVSDCLGKLDMVLLPAAIGITLAVWGVMVIFTLAGRHTTPLKYTSKFRSIPIVLAAMAWSTSFGYYSLEVLARYGIARVRWEMDAWVLTPIAINIGMAIGTAFVCKLERKRIAKVEARAERPISVEEFLAEEKQPLVEV